MVNTQSQKIRLQEVFSNHMYVQLSTHSLISWMHTFEHIKRCLWARKLQVMIMNLQPSRGEGH